MKIGLTGGIGSGKSEVSRCFEELGIHVVDADIVAREVVQPGSEALAQIAQEFGPEILLANGELNRARLRQIIFADLTSKTWLEQLLHPLIREAIVRQLNATPSPYVILSSPLLLETNQFELVDHILVVDATPELQIQRASSRDNNSAEQIQKIMASQLDRETRLAKADDVIHNHNSLADLRQQVKKLHEFYLQECR